MSTNIIKINEKFFSIMSILQTHYHFQFDFQQEAWRPNKFRCMIRLAKHATPLCNGIIVQRIGYTMCHDVERVPNRQTYKNTLHSVEYVWFWRRIDKSTRGIQKSVIYLI